MKRSLALSLGLALTAAYGQAQAGNLVDLGVTDLDTGAQLRVYRNGGKFYVAGTPGHRYALALDNRTGGRVLTVVSVDGVNAVTGQTAAPLQSGYVLGAYEHADIRGWRKNMSESAEFVFTSVPKSYAARTGRPQNVGVIGIAVFREQAPQYEYPSLREGERDDRAAAEPAPPASAAADEGYAARGGNESAPAQAKAEAQAAQPVAKDGALAAAAPAGAAKSIDTERRVRQELGTGHGERRYDPIGSTAFQRASDTPDEVVTLFYDDWNGLVSRGVVAPPRWERRAPDPFPLTFVPDPPRG